MPALPLIMMMINILRERMKSNNMNFEEEMANMPSDDTVGANDNAKNSALNGSMLNAGAEIGGGIGSMFLQNQQQQKMFDKTNEYNSPSAMMQRMTSAGITPATAAAGIAGAPTSGTATMPTAAAPTNPDLEGLGQMFQNANKIDAQTDNIKTATEKAHAEIDEIKQKITNFQMQCRNLLADTELKEKLNNNEYWKYILGKIESEIHFNDAQWSRSWEEILNIDMDTKQKEKLLEMYEQQKQLNEINIRLGEIGVEIQAFKRDQEEFLTVNQKADRIWNKILQASMIFQNFGNGVGSMIGGIGDLMTLNFKPPTKIGFKK